MPFSAIRSAVKSAFETGLSPQSSLSASSPGQPQLRHDSRVLSVYLREPWREVRKILRHYQHYQYQFEYRRRHQLSKQVLQQHVQSFVFPQHSDYTRLITADSRSRILATFHFGDFIYGLNYVASRVGIGGGSRVLTLQAGSAAHWRNLRVAFAGKAAGREAELLSDNTNPAALSGILRQPGNTLVLFCDLPAGFGEVTAVNFLGRTAWFPRGPATMAVFNRVPVLPIITFTQNRQNHILLFPQIEPQPLAGETLHACVARITQRLVNILAQSLQSCPEQWRYLRSLPLYFVSPDDPSPPPATQLH